jgi:hypothetical protein
LSQPEQKRLFSQPTHNKILPENFSKNIVKNASLSKLFPSVCYEERRVAINIDESGKAFNEQYGK